MGKPGVPRPRPKASEPPREAEVDGLDEGEEISRTEPARNVDLQPGHVIDGKYELEQPLAKGGMGAIWVARHLKLNEPVAIKFMSAELAASKEALVRFEREATAVAQLQRKTTHVVHIHDYGIDGNNPYIVMELLEGETLHTRLKRCGRLMLHEVAAIVEQLCRALRPAHQAGIVHRDIKPSNVFINRKGDEEVLKVIDFGLAKGDALDVTGESTKSGGVLGSPHYMSPEQATGNAPVDHRSDVWAVGVVAYRCVVGKLPFPGTKLGDILVRVARDPAPSPSTLVQGVPEELDAFFPEPVKDAKGHAGCFGACPRRRVVSEMRIPEETQNHPFFEFHELAQPMEQKVTKRTAFGTHWGLVYFFGDNPLQLRDLLKAQEELDFYV